MLFLNKHYAQATSPNFATSPRAFLLSLTAIAPPHALLVAHWGSEGAAVLSLPTKEYFQSSGWVEERPRVHSPITTRGRNPENSQRRTDAGEPEQSADVLSVRSGSDFWARPQSGASSSAFTASQYMTSEEGGNSGTRRSSPSYARSPRSGHGRNGSTEDEDDNDNDSQGTEMPEEEPESGVVDEVGAQDAFVAGMIYALSRRIAPGAPYTPSSGGEDSGASLRDLDRGRWRLDECLRSVWRQRVFWDLCSLPLTDLRLSSQAARLDGGIGMD